MAWMVCVVAALAALSGEARGDEPEPGRGPALGSNAAIEVGTGFHGGMSFAEAGVALPQFLPNFRISLGAIGMSAATWATFSDQETLETTTIHPVILGGTLSIGGTSEPVQDLLRAYGSVKWLLGTTKTPYDDFFYGTDDLVDDKLTYGLFAAFGLEVVSGTRSSFFVEGGGGFRSLVVDDEEDRYAVTAAWLGSGAMVRLGTRIYLGRKES